MRRVGLIGPPDRDELIRLAIRIEERDGEAVFLDSRSDPEIEIAPGSVRACGEVLDDLVAAYVADLGIRPYQVTAEDGGPDQEASRSALSASRRHLATWNALLARLATRARIVNPPVTHDLHGLKAWEAAAYARQGLPVPITVATNDPERLVALAAEHPGKQWITKGLIGGLGYTEAFDPPESAAAAQKIVAGGPILVQEKVEGLNLRAYIVNRELVGAAEIISASGEEIDSRRGLKRVKAVELPEEARRHAVAAAARWGMSFAAVDMIFDPAQDRYVLLECNSAPFYVGFERLTGIDVSSRLAAHLLGR